MPDTRDTGDKQATNELYVPVCVLRSKPHALKFDEIWLAVIAADLRARSDTGEIFTSQFDPRKRYLGRCFLE